MTNKEFCKLDTQFYGEETSHIKQIALRTFNGEELKEYVEHCIKFNFVVLGNVRGSASDFEQELFRLVNNYCKKGLEKPDLVNTMEWVTDSCKMS